MLHAFVGLAGHAQNRVCQSGSAVKTNCDDRNLHGLSLTPDDKVPASAQSASRYQILFPKDAGRF